MTSEPATLAPPNARQRLPSWRIWAGFAGALLLIQAVSVAKVYLSGPYEYPLTLGLVFHQLMFWFSWYAVAPIVFLLARRFPLDRPTPGRVAAHIFAAPVLFAIAAVLRTAARWPFFGPPRDTALEAVTFAFTSSLTLFVMLYALTLLLYYTVQYYRAYHSRELRASQLETMVVRARLEALRNQLQPHFLFNTLHAISALMAKDVPAARRMMTRFSDLLRLALDEPDQHEVSLTHELRFIDQYLDLQRMRYGERLQVDLDVAPSTLDCMVPRLILQPLVDNALTHGIGARSGAGRIRIAAELADGALRLDVEDDGPGLASGRGELLQEGVGLRNTRTRLLHLYGDSASLQLSDVPGDGLCVTITIPAPLSRPRSDAAAAIPA
jgi:two-component system, LytTR family, sensor kinase